LSSAFIFHWPIAEEVLTDQVVGSSTPTQDLAPASPRVQPASPQLEVSVLPDHPASPQPAIQEPSTEPEKSPSPIRETRNDVSMKIHLSILFIQRITTNLARKTLSGGNCIITNILLCFG
jgi:hypothetical protein